MEIKKRTISFTDRMDEMIEEIKSAKGYISTSAVIHAAIIELHSKAFPAYANRPLAKDEPVADKIKRKQAEKDAKAELIRQEYLRIAEALGGRVVNENGNEYCIYYTYFSKRRYEQKVPLHMLSTDLIPIQYQPSREAVEKLQKDGKTEYQS